MLSWVDATDSRWVCSRSWRHDHVVDGWRHDARSYVATSWVRIGHHIDVIVQPLKSLEGIENAFTCGLSLTSLCPPPPSHNFLRLSPKGRNHRSDAAFLNIVSWYNLGYLYKTQGQIPVREILSWKFLIVYSAAGIFFFDKFLSAELFRKQKLLDFSNFVNLAICKELMYPHLIWQMSGKKTSNHEEEWSYNMPQSLCYISSFLKDAAILLSPPNCLFLWLEFAVKTFPFISPVIIIN